MPHATALHAVTNRSWLVLAVLTVGTAVLGRWIGMFGEVAALFVFAGFLTYLLTGQRWFAFFAMLAAILGIAALGEGYIIWFGMNATDKTAYAFGTAIILFMLGQVLVLAVPAYLLGILVDRAPARTRENRGRVKIAALLCFAFLVLPTFALLLAVR